MQRGDSGRRRTWKGHFIAFITETRIPACVEGLPWVFIGIHAVRSTNFIPPSLYSQISDEANSFSCSVPNSPYRDFSLNFLGVSVFNAVNPDSPNSMLNTEVDQFKGIFTTHGRPSRPVSTLREIASHRNLWQGSTVHNFTAKSQFSQLCAGKCVWLQPATCRQSDFLEYMHIVLTNHSCT